MVVVNFGEPVINQNALEIFLNFDDCEHFHIVQLYMK